MQTRDGLPNRPTPEDGHWGALPSQAWRVEKSLVPEEAVVEATGGRRLTGSSRAASDFLRNEVLGVPELVHARIGNASEDAAARRAPIGGENGLPNYQDAKIGLVFLLEELSDCGGPPQAGGSSG